MSQDPVTAPSRFLIRNRPAPALLILAMTTALFGVFSQRWLEDLSVPVRVGVVFTWLFVAIVWGGTLGSPAPEGVSALRAALRNELQRSVNILLGSVLATLALTTTAVLIIDLLRHTPVTLGLEGAQQPMLVLTLLLGTITFANGVTNILQGAIHLVLFLGFLMLILWP